MNLGGPARGTAYYVWRELAIAGFVVTLLLLVDGFADAFLDVHVIEFYNLVPLIPVGMAIMYAGSIGWARYFPRAQRFWIAAGLISPWFVLAAIDSNVHGPGMIAVLIAVPSIVVAIVLLAIPQRKRTLPSEPPLRSGD